MALTLVSPSSLVVLVVDVVVDEEVAGMGETVVVRVLEKEVLVEWEVV